MIPRHSPRVLVLGLLTIITLVQPDEERGDNVSQRKVLHHAGGDQTNRPPHWHEKRRNGMFTWMQPMRTRGAPQLTTRARIAQPGRKRANHAGPKVHPAPPPCPLQRRSRHRRYPPRRSLPPCAPPPAYYAAPPQRASSSLDALTVANCALAFIGLGGRVLAGTILPRRQSSGHCRASRRFGQGTGQAASAAEIRRGDRHSLRASQE